MKKITRSLLITLTAVCLCASTALAATITTAGSGNWNSTTANAPWPGGTVPANTDNVIIRAGDNVTNTANSTINSITFNNASSSTATLTINSGVTNTVTAGVTNQNSATINTAATIQGAGALACTSFTVGGNVTPTDNSTHTTTLTSTVSTLSISGNLTITGRKGTGGRVNDATFALSSGSASVGGTVVSNPDSGSTSTLTLATGAQTGALTLSGTTTFTTSGGTTTFSPNGTAATVIYSGSAQTVQPATYRSLTLSGSGVKTLTSVSTISSNLTLSGTATATNAANLGIGGTLDIGSGTVFTVAGFNITVTNATSVTGTLVHSSSTGTKTYIGAVTINSGGVWNNTGNAAVTFRGGLTHNGTTFTAGTGVQTFNTNSQTIGGTSAISIPSVTVTTVNLTNAGTLTITTALAGTGALVNSAAGTLNVNFSGAMGITTLTATAPGNTVNYSFAGAQTVKGTSYDKLTLSGSGAKTTTSITVSNTLSMQGTATATATPTYGAGATLEYAGSAAQTTGAELASTIPNLTINNASDVNVNSTATVSGTLTLTSGKVNTSANVLGIGTAGSISGASSARYINGNLLKAYNSGSGQSFTYPIGDTNYTPVELVSLDLSPGGNLTAKTTAGEHPGGSTNSLDPTLNVNRYWTLTPSGGIGVSAYDATFNFINPGDVDGAADTDSFIIRRFSGTAWFTATTSARTSTSITATNFTSFSDFAVGQPSLTLNCTNKNVECTSAWTFDDPTALSACSNVTITVISTTTNTSGHCGTTFDATRSYQATDDCSTNIVTCSQTVTVIDTTAPAVTTDQGADATIECPATPSFSDPVFTDACEGVITPSVLTVTNVVGCTNIVTRTWTATDDCSNTTNRSQIITVVDTTAPAVTTDQGADATIECPATPSFSAPVFTDVCQGVITPSVSTVTNVVGCTNIVTRTWTADDGCGNSTNRSQVITVVDTTAPAVTTDQGADATIECPATPSFSDPVFTDACQGVITPSVSTITNTVGCTNIVTRTWTADDGCGNSTNRSQVITVIDTTAPAVTTDQGADATVECPAVFSAPVFTDACQGVITPSVSTVTNTVGCTNILTRTWTADDGCGNSTNRSQVLTVIDTTAPAVTTDQGADATIECPATPSFSDPVFTDACQGVITPSVSTVTNVVGCTNIVTRTWTADDGCGNSTNRSQVITVIDTTVPDVTTDQGADATIECPATPSFSAPVFTDVCQGVIAPSVSTVTNVVGCTNIVTRTWTANDGCGNSTNRSQVITVIDTTAPAVTTDQGADATIECPATPSFSDPVFTDACQGVITPSVSTVTNTVGCTNILTRTWTADDGCGNSTNRSQVLTVIDTTAPAVTTDQGADATIECPATPSFSDPVFTDACQGVITPSVSTVTNVVGCTNIVTRTWTADDGCGNSTNRSQVITIVDTTAPAVTTDQGADATIECPATPSFSDPVFTDACQGVITPSVSTVTNVVGCTNIVTRTWTADDGCGNSTNRSQVITIVDTTAPAVTTDQGADATIECPATPSFSDPVFTDACQGIITPSVSTVTNVVGCTNIVTRTWTANDGCGNSTNRSQVITVIDTTAPAVTTDQGADATIECPATPSFSDPVFMDACQGVITPSISTVTNAVGCSSVVTRTWTANDGCGNSTNRSQVITVVDTTVPMITCATNKTVECGSVWTFDAPSASDTCSSATITVLSTVTNGTFCPMTVTRTWQATDDCTNSVTCTQTVMVAACPTITLSPGTLTNGTAGSAYSETIMATGSIAPYTFAVDSGSLPGGLSLSGGGLLSGTATAGGTFNFDVVATAASGCMGTQSYSLTIDCPAISLDPTNLPNAVAGEAYNQTVTATNGTAPYTFSVNTNSPNGPLPPGLSLNETNGVLSGTPTVTGAFPIEIVALDLYGCGGSQTHTVTVSCAIIVLSPSGLPTGVVGSNYSQTISVSGGLPPYTFTNSGSLPAGLTLSSGGSLTGIPTAGGTNNFTITATDAAGCTGSSNYTIIITVPDGIAPGVTLISPKTKSDVTNAVISVDGKAVDASGIAQVLVRVNGGAYGLASLSGILWTNSAVTLATGTNAINAKAIDNTGMEGTSKTNFVFLKVTNTLTLVQGGDGTATTLTGNALSVPGGTEQPLLGTSILDIGRSYTLNIIPAPGSLFSNVLEVVNGATNVLYTATSSETQKGNKKMPFTMKTNLTLIVNIVTNRFVNSGGIYYGLYSEGTTAHESSGWFTVKVDSKLKFTGKLYQEGEIVPFAGTFDMAGLGTPKPGKNISRKAPYDADILTLGLQVDMGSLVSLSGTVQSTNWGGAASMDADKSIDGAKVPLTLPPSVTNAFAMVMVGSTNAAALPAGDGHVLNFKGIDNAKGKFNAKGYTGEGAGVKVKTVTTGVFTNGSWPFYALLYQDPVNKKHYHGAMIGWLTINNGVTGDIVWTKKSTAATLPYSGGFTTMFSSGDSSLLSSPVTNAAAPPLSGMPASGTLTIQDGNFLPSPTVTTFTYDGAGKVTVPGSKTNGIKVIIKPTAAAKGNVDLTPNKWVGVVLQNAGEVRGAFSTGGVTSGSVRLTP